MKKTIRDAPEFSAYTTTEGAILCLACAPDDKTGLAPAAMKGQKCFSCGREVYRIACSLFKRGRS